MRRVSTFPIRVSMPSSLPFIRTISIFTSTTSALRASRRPLNSARIALSFAVISERSAVISERSALSFAVISERSAVISERSEFTLPFTEKNMLMTSARVVSETPKIATSALIRGICEVFIPQNFVSDAISLASFRAATR